ncbi:unnamed protein product, partial [Scytosiphon promiscuus]
AARDAGGGGAAAASSPGHGPSGFAARAPAPLLQPAPPTPFMALHTARLPIGYGGSGTVVPVSAPGGPAPAPPAPAYPASGASAGPALGGDGANGRVREANGGRGGGGGGSGNKRRRTDLVPNGSVVQGGTVNMAFEGGCYGSVQIHNKRYLAVMLDADDVAAGRAVAKAGGQPMGPGLLDFLQHRMTHGTMPNFNPINLSVCPIPPAFGGLS